MSPVPARRRHAAAPRHAAPAQRRQVRKRRSSRGGSVGVIAAGIALCAVMATSSPAASARGAGPAPVRQQAAVPALALAQHAGPAAGQFSELRPVHSESTPAPAARSVRSRKPSGAPTEAPVDQTLISSLAANGIPSVALNAYRVAAARMADVDPGCGIDWALLAGIGREESDHGRFGGAVLHTDGTSTPPIIGPALDGLHWDYIPAPADGLALDGDAKFAHALGPMQFIPSTWALYGADANGDGVADVFNINDAALGTARYLCAAGGNLRTRAGQAAAVLAYNHNDQYLAQVLALADAYRRGIPITGLPVGITSGPLPKTPDIGYLPPANPGDPTAVGNHHRGDKSHHGKHRHRTRRKHGPTGTPTPRRTTTPARTPSPSPSPSRTRRKTTPPPLPSTSPAPTSSTPSSSTASSSTASTSTAASSTPAGAAPSA